jgi:hypothetical protein
MVPSGPFLSTPWSILRTIEPALTRCPMKKIVALLAIAAVVVSGFLWHRRQVRMRSLTSGEVYVRDQPSAPPQPLTPSQPANDQIATAATPQPPAAAPQAFPTPAEAPPETDSIPRNPPNGLVFAGSGKFQLYRQGDITWRLDTQSGSACILFATDAQWHRTRVFQAGCGTHGETTVATGD